MTLDRLLLAALAVSAALFTAAVLGKVAQLSQMEECRSKASDLLERIVIREQFQTEEDERLAAIRKIYWSFAQAHIDVLRDAQSRRWANMHPAEALADCHRQVVGMEQELNRRAHP